MNITVIGGTWATHTCITTLRDLGHTVTVHHIPYDPNIAGWEQLDGTPYLAQPIPTTDALIVVGCSQLIPATVYEPFPLHAGFHPTRLPNGRGRAPVPWMILGHAEPAVTFFQLEPTADTGPIYVQRPYAIGPDDYAQDVHDQIAIEMRAVLRANPIEHWVGTPQKEEDATWLGVRKPEDGRINWDDTADNIHQLVRAVSHPYPGAHDDETIIWRATPVDIPYHGVTGRTVTYQDWKPVIQCGTGHLRLDDYT